MNERKRVIIRSKSTGEVIASSGNPLRFESNLYFDEKDVNFDLLSVTDRIYTCSYKGQCFWIDLRDEQEETGIIQNNVAWVYRDPFPGYEHIKDKIGFSSRESQHINVEYRELETRRADNDL